MTDFNVEAELARMSRTDRYFLKSGWSDRGWEEVSKQTFINAERGAGFRPKYGGDGVATGGFGSSNGVSGRVVSIKPDGTPYSAEHYQQHEPEFYALLMGKSDG